MGNYLGRKKPPNQEKTILKLPNGDIYKGYLLDSCPHGQGKLKSVEGDLYIGNFKNGVIEGIGKMFYKIGEFYRGTWLNKKDKRETRRLRTLFLQ